MCPMALIVAWGSGDKGGPGKSTQAVTTARILAEDYRVLLVDADSVHSSVDWIDRGSDAHFPFDVADAVGQIDRLPDLRGDTAYDVIVVDLPGVAVGAFQSILTGHGGQPIADLLMIPSRHNLMELQPLVRAIDDEITPSGIPYMLVLTRVPTKSLELAHQRRDELRGRKHHAPVTVADTIIRFYTAYEEAHEDARTVIDEPGARSYARVAEAEQRALVAEIRTALNLPAGRRR